MTPWKFIRNNLRHYWKRNLLFALGVAVSGAVITGALMVGDSVKHSLQQIVVQRLGQVSHVMRAGDRYFSEAMVERMGEEIRREQELEDLELCGLLLQEGSATAGGGQLRINQVQVLGVDAGFDRVSGLSPFYSQLTGDSVILNRRLATALNAAPGEEILLRMEKASLVPANAPFVSDVDHILTRRVVIKAIAGEEELGGFNLKVSQTSPYNLFMSKEGLQELMDFQGMVNVMLLSTGGALDPGDILAGAGNAISLVDAALDLKWVEEGDCWQLGSRRVFFDDGLGSRILETIPTAEGIITYFVNALSLDARSTPYSFVSTLQGQGLKDDEMILSSWLAEDLGARVGDRLDMRWFQVGPLRELEEVAGSFVVSQVLSPDESPGDRQLMPDLPGLSDAGNCRDWDTGVPITLDEIRDKDEEYWDAHGGTPKAYISAERGREIWKNRFGTYTAFRFDPGDSATLAAAILEAADPAALGFTAEATRARGQAAAAAGVDFSQLFLGLSFFLLASGILLAVLLFLMNLESREEQLRTLVVLGIPLKRLRGMVFVEGLFVSLVGVFLGLLLAILYNRLVFHALNGIWADVVRTPMMHVQVKGQTLVLGAGLTLLTALLSLYFPLNRKLKAFRQRHIPVPEGREERGARRKQRFFGIAGASGVLMALLMILSQLPAGASGNAALFFSAGTLLLLSAILLLRYYLGRQARRTSASFGSGDLSRKNATRHMTRSMSIMILFAIGAFLVISTGSKRKDLFAGAGERSSGTGGFLYYAESTLPILRQLNDPEVRYAYSLGEDYRFVQLRRAEGDDASCLNLNQVLNPRILGVAPAALSGRFSFVSASPWLHEDDPWSTLDTLLPGGLIPAIADETVIKWGLGMAVGDTLRYSNARGKAMDLLLVGGTAPSIFQGSVLISEEHFLEQYPASSGTHVFLVEGEAADTALIRDEFHWAFRDLGWEMDLAAVRLAAFNSVTNAYLSIFMVMGALGLLLGICGLVVVLGRSILERQKEIALLRAVGYSSRRIRRLIQREYMGLLMAGILAGFACALLATLPSFMSEHSGSSLPAVLAWLLILTASGWIMIRLVSGSVLRKLNIRKGLSDE